MTNHRQDFKNSILNKLIFIVSIFTLLSWITGKTVDIYRYAFIGALFEIFWIFMLLFVFTLPLVTVVLLIRDSFNIRSLNLYSVVISVSTLLMLIFIE